MTPSSFVSRARFAVLASCIAAFAFPAAALDVSPLAVEANVANRGGDSQFVVTNTEIVAVPLEITVQRISVDRDGKVTVIPGGENDLFLLPPQTTIPSGQAQTFRVQYVGDPAITQSQSYYVSVNQVPVQQPEGSSNVQIVYNFRILVNVAPAQGSAAVNFTGYEIAMVDGKPRPSLIVQNAGNKHALMARIPSLTIVQRNAAGAEIFRETYAGGRMQEFFGLGLVMPNSQRRFVLPIDLPSAAGQITAEVGDGR